MIIIFQGKQKDVQKPFQSLSMLLEKSEFIHFGRKMLRRYPVNGADKCIQIFDKIKLFYMENCKIQKKKLLLREMKKNRCS